MSLHTLVHDSLAGRLRLRRDATERGASRSAVTSIRISISSMRILETGLALCAIATALLIGSQ